VPLGLEFTSKLGLHCLGNAIKPYLMFIKNSGFYFSGIAPTHCRLQLKAQKTQQHSLIDHAAKIP
jgi:hypothetical protein